MNARCGDIVAVIESTGMVCRGDIVTTVAKGLAEPVAGESVTTVVMVSNVGRALRRNFKAARSVGQDPLDAWTRTTLLRIASELGASLVHPSDELYQPLQRWARRAGRV